MVTTHFTAPGWRVHHEPLKYRDNYRQGVQRFVQNRVPRSSRAPLRSARADGSLLRQLEQSLDSAEGSLSGEPCLANAAPDKKGTKAGGFLTRRRIRDPAEHA